MKILFVIHALTGGGAERVFATVANSLVSKGYEICLLTDLQTPFSFSISKDIRLFNLYDDCSSSNDKWNNFINSIKIRNNIRKTAKYLRPDVIVAFMSSLGCTTVFATLGLGIPVIICEHTNVSRNLGGLLNLRRRLLYPFATAITVLTRWDYRLWRNHMRNVVYLPNPIELHDINKNERKKVVLAVGRVNQWKIKGFDNLIECWGRLCHDFPDWKLQIAGDYNEATGKILREMACYNKVVNLELLGFRSDIGEIMAHSEIFCLSSRVEGLPMALIEAMSRGCCCVSFDVITGPREIIINGKTGLLAKNQDNDDLTLQLRKVMSDSNLRYSLSSNAPHSIKKFSIDRIILRWEILIKKIRK